MRKGYCSADARPLLFENGISYCMLTGACRIRKGWLLVIVVAVRIWNCGVLIKNSNLSQSFTFPEKFRFIQKSNPFPQPHSFPFDVRHNLLSSKEFASSSYKTVYSILLSMELAAVQIIAVDSVRNSGFCKVGYLSKAGHPIQNNVSTGDLNRPQSPEGRNPLGYFWFFS